MGNTMTMLRVTFFAAAASLVGGLKIDGRAKQPSLYAICGQDVKQVANTAEDLPEGPLLNVMLREKFLETAADGDWGIFAGTPYEKAAFEGKHVEVTRDATTGKHVDGTQIVISGKTDFPQPWKTLEVKHHASGAVKLNVYKLPLFGKPGKAYVAILETHHSKQTIHNAIETVWALTMLRHHDLVSDSWRSIAPLVLDKSQIDRFAHIVATEQRDYKKIIMMKLLEQEGVTEEFQVKDNKGAYMLSPAIVQMDEARKILRDEHAMTADNQPMIDHLFTLRTDEYLGAGVMESSKGARGAFSLAYQWTMSAYRNTQNNAVHIGSRAKAVGEEGALKKYGAGYNMQDLLALLDNENIIGKVKGALKFDMSGERVGGVMGGA